MDLEISSSEIQLFVAPEIASALTGLFLELSTPQGLRLRWSPLLTNRSHVAVQVLSPCCAMPFDIPMNPASLRYTCSRCFTPATLPSHFINLSNPGKSWCIDAPDHLAAICDFYADPLNATFLASQLTDLLVEIMNRASAEYAWAPEGNLRGSDPLPLEKQRIICDKLVHRFRTEGLIHG